MSNMSNVKLVSTIDPQDLLRRAKEVEQIAHIPTRQFYASLLVPDIDRAMEAISAETAKAVHLGEARAYKLGQLKERMAGFGVAAD